MFEHRKSMGNLWGYHGSSVGTNFGVLKLVILTTLQKLARIVVGIFELLEAEDNT